MVIYLYKFDNCLLVRLFVTFCVIFCPNFFVTFLGQINSKRHQTFTRWKVWSPELYTFVWASAHACMHAQHVKSCTLFLPTFQISFFNILKPFLTENEKTEATFKKVMYKTELFHFIFFSFKVWKSFKMAANFFFTVFGQNLGQIQTKLSHIFAKLSGLAPNGPPRSI